MAVFTNMANHENDKLYCFMKNCMGKVDKIYFFLMYMVENYRNSQRIKAQVSHLGP